LIQSQICSKKIQNNFSFSLTTQSDVGSVSFFFFYFCQSDNPDGFRPWPCRFEPAAISRSPMLLLLPLPAPLPLFPLLLGVAPLLQTDASKAIMHHSPPVVVRSLPSPIKGAIRPDIPPASRFVHQIHSSVPESRCRRALFHHCL
jgi:hypothetical protein